MTRMDPLTQTLTVPNASAPPRVSQAPDSATAPAEAVSRFVPAINRGTESNTLEAGYAAVRVRRRMTGQMAGLSDLDSRLSGTAEGLRATRGASATGPDDQAAVAAAEAEARMAELRGAASALKVAISGARADVAAVLRQMQTELVAAMEALSKGREAGSGGATEGMLSGTSSSGETLVRQASTLSARASRD